MKKVITLLISILWICGCSSIDYSKGTKILSRTKYEYNSDKRVTKKFWEDVSTDIMSYNTEKFKYIQDLNFDIIEHYNIKNEMTCKEFLEKNKDFKGRSIIEENYKEDNVIKSIFSYNDNKTLVEKYDKNNILLEKVITVKIENKKDKNEDKGIFSDINSEIIVEKYDRNNILLERVRIVEVENKKENKKTTIYFYPEYEEEYVEQLKRCSYNIKERIVSKKRNFKTTKAENYLGNFKIISIIMTFYNENELLEEEVVLSKIIE